MAVVDFAELTAPVSESEPCGPDLDLAGDMKYMNFVARVGLVIPEQYFRDGKPFDRASVDFTGEFAALKPLLAQTRDLRLLTTLAKLSALNRDLDSFTSALKAIAALLEHHWDDVHPRGEDGDFTFRMAAIETLDDSAPVLMPLQFMPLAEHRRHGAISYRRYLIATGAAKAPEDEQALDLPTLEKALMEVDLPALTAVWRTFETLQMTVGTIHGLCRDRDAAVKLERLPELLEKILALLDGVVTKRDPGAARLMQAGGLADGASAETPEAAAAPPLHPPGAIGSPAAAAEALAAVSQYFSRCEPSNPALLLVRQAQQLMGKSLFEVMRILVPEVVDQAAIQIGKQQIFKLSIERLAGLAPPEGEVEAAADAPTAAHPAPAEAGAVDGAGVAAAAFTARTRQDAVALLDAIGAYYRHAEPSSPVPFLTERARDLAGRDFLSLLKDLLPASAFRAEGE
jgi:type VI secretion system protein ImpA